MTTSPAEAGTIGDLICSRAALDRHTRPGEIDAVLPSRLGPSDRMG
jgi:hypothetical protein